MRCPKCKNKVLQKSDAGTKLRVKGQVLFDKAGAHAQCFWCGENVLLPIVLSVETEEPKRFILPPEHIQKTR